MLTGRGDLAMLDALDATPLADARVRLGDARDLDDAEGEALAVSGIRRASRLDALLETLPDGAAVHLHLDCDVITSDEVPAQSYPVAGGPSAAEVERFLRALGGAHADRRRLGLRLGPGPRRGRRIGADLPSGASTPPAGRTSGRVRTLRFRRGRPVCPIDVSAPRQGAVVRRETVSKTSPRRREYRAKACERDAPART